MQMEGAMLIRQRNWVEYCIRICGIEVHPFVPVVELTKEGDTIPTTGIPYSEITAPKTSSVV